MCTTCKQLKYQILKSCSFSLQWLCTTLRLSIALVIQITDSQITILSGIFYLGKFDSCRKIAQNHLYRSIKFCCHLRCLTLIQINFLVYMMKMNKVEITIWQMSQYCFILPKQKTKKTFFTGKLYDCSNNKRVLKKQIIS